MMYEIPKALPWAGLLPGLWPYCDTRELDTQALEQILIGLNVVRREKGFHRLSGVRCDGAVL